MPTIRPFPRAALGLLLLLGASLGLTACGDDTDDDAATESEETSQADDTEADDTAAGDTAAGDTDDADPDDAGTETDDAGPTTTAPADGDAETTETDDSQTATADDPTTTLPADSGLPPDGDLGTNEGGVPITLDETATLACAHGEFARDALAADDVDGAMSQLTDAAGRAAPSAVPELAELAEALAEANADDAEQLVTDLLEVCVANGHQI